MISNASLLTEIEKYIAIAKNVKDDQQIREHFSAIRAICDVALLMNTQQKSNQQNQNQNQNQSSSSSQQQQGNLMNNLSSMTGSQGQDSGNSDSIFDF